MGDDLRRRASSRRHYREVTPQGVTSASINIARGDRQFCNSTVYDPGDSMVIGLIVPSHPGRGDPPGVTRIGVDTVHEMVDTLRRGLVARGHTVVMLDPASKRDSSQLLKRCDLIHQHDIWPQAMAPVAGIRFPDVVTGYYNGTQSASGLSQDVDCEVAGFRHSTWTPANISLSNAHRRQFTTDSQTGHSILPGLDLTKYHFQPKVGDHLVAVGDLAPGSGLDRAIDLACRIGIPIRFAAELDTPAQRDWFNEEIRPILGPWAEYIGPADSEARLKLLADACAYINVGWRQAPIDYCAIEAMACGVPVLCTDSGAWSEVIEPGVTGHAVRTTGDLIRATNDIGRFNRRRCRQRAEDLFSMSRSAFDHEQVYRQILDSAWAQTSSRLHAMAKPPI